MSSTPTSTASTSWSQRLQPLVRAFHGYARWLVSISWIRFTILAILLLIGANMLQSLPPFSWKFREVIEDSEPPRPPKPPKSPREFKEPVIRIEKGAGSSDAGGKSDGVDISIDSRGVRVLTRKPEVATPAASAASGAAAASAAGAVSADAASAPRQVKVEIRTTNKDQDDQASVRISLPPGADTKEVREAVEQASREFQEAMKDLRDQDPPEESGGGTVTRVRHVQLGESLPEFALLWILASIIIKITYRGQLQAQAEAAQASEVAAQATENAEAEQLRRQVAEARMAAMQAQVEPHFLFNTLASIDHLIETDPPRASQMQKSLIALLRATMPTLREGGAVGSRNLGQEIDVIVPYLDILKVRMEDRLQSTIDVPSGLRSAEFPPMMLQGLVENAIKHGLEPKAEGGTLSVRATIEDGVLQLTVCDTGVGLEQAADANGTSTQGGGSGLQNIRERLALLFGNQASLKMRSLPEGGTCATITVPYRVTTGA